MTCACVKSPPVKAGLMTLGSLVADVVIIGGMIIGIQLTGPQDPNQMTFSQGAVIILAILAGCWFPLWAPYKVGDYIDSL